MNQYYYYLIVFLMLGLYMGYHLMQKQLTNQTNQEQKIKEEELKVLEDAMVFGRDMREKLADLYYQEQPDLKILKEHDEYLMRNLLKLDTLQNPQLRQMRKIMVRELQDLLTHVDRLKTK